MGKETPIYIIEVRRKDSRKQNRFTWRERRRRRMEAPKNIEHQIGGIQNDTLRYGLNSVKSNLVGSHPVESAHQSTKKMQEEMERRILANTYGTAFPMRMDFERQMLSRFQRPTGAIPSSMLGLESLTGDLDYFGPEDYMNDPRESETARPLDTHHAMEVRIGLSKGPVAPSFY
ncbi:putative proteasome maturation factor Ump1 [Rosa chinensis]|uniref:Putative proteasome maturation factor Ump1 n=2 Tax=Rosa chinensis TaxID=74649 RepID=A0A2P6S384_ROSCH|nr:putative proteasome maturation factor Ump1 [Rosa chinensis]